MFCFIRKILKKSMSVSYKIAHNVKVLCAVRDFENETFSLPQKPDISTNVQLTTSAPIAQNTCYKLAAVNYRKTQIEALNKKN